MKEGYGTGYLHKVGDIWHIAYREVRRNADGTSQYIQHRESTKLGDKKAARDYLNKKLAEIGGWRRRIVNPKHVSYENIRDFYLEQTVAAGSRSIYTSKDGKPRLSTITRLDKFFNGWRAADISVADLRRFRQECRKQISDVGTNRCMAAIRRMFKLALQNEVLTPTEVPGHFPMVHEPNEAIGAIFIEDAWYEALCKTLPEPLRSAFVLCYHTGIRVLEMRRVRWRDFDFAKRQIHLSGSITKTGRPRNISIPSAFRLRPGALDDLAFPLGNFSSTWHEACAAIGAGRQTCRTCGSECREHKCPKHGKMHPRALVYSGPLLRHCRHTFVKNAIDAGLPEAVVMQMTGHVTRSMLDRYSIGRERDVDQVRAKLELFLEERRPA